MWQLWLIFLWVNDHVHWQEIASNLEYCNIRKWTLTTSCFIFTELHLWLVRTCFELKLYLAFGKLNTQFWKRFLNWFTWEHFTYIVSTRSDRTLGNSAVTRLKLHRTNVATNLLSVLPNIHCFQCSNVCFICSLSFESCTLYYFHMLRLLQHLIFT